MRGRTTAVLAMLAVPAVVAAGCGRRAGADGVDGMAAVTASPIVSTFATNDDSSVSYGITFTGTHSFFRVYIDADQSTATGLATAGIGAEYLIETDALYRYTGTGASWSWARGKTISFTSTAGAVSWRVARADLGELAPCTERADLIFDVTDAHSAKVTQIYTPAATCSAPSPTPPPAGGPASGPIFALGASNDATTVSYRFGFTGAPGFFRVYVDTDLNAATGFAAVPGVGAEYLLENGTLYSHAGAGWSWSSLGSVTFSAANQVASWTVARSRIGEIAPCGEASALAFQTQDSAIHSSAAFADPFTGGASSCAPAPGPPAPSRIQYVFVIAMENEAAAAIYGNASAPYINGQLIPRYARAGAFADPLPDDVPSEPHYVWMEAGTDQFADTTFTSNADPSPANSTASAAHLVAQMGAAAPPVTWRAYQESMDAATTGACPIVSAGLYTARHNPFVFFQDVAGNPPSASNLFCAEHHRAYTTSGFAADLQRGDVAGYTFITPNLCNDMHGDPACPATDVISAGDAWLSINLPPLIDFATAHAGAIFVVWDEPLGGSTLIPFLAIGPHVKANYDSPVTFTHGSLTRSAEEIFRLPILPAVASVNDFGDLFDAGFFP